MFVDIDGQARALRRLELGRAGEDDGQRREAFVQKLVHDHPALVPMADIEPAYSPLISVCCELPTPAGYLDNLWITPWGGLVLGEAKLVRNPQARREVVAQVLDYARALSGWSYEDLQNGVRLALKQPTMTLWDLVREDSDLDEGQFVDAVERRLRTGRLMLLIIGDGIQEGVEALTAHLQLHAGLHVGLALLDLSLWRDVNGGLIVVPRVPMRTVLIERGIVRVEGEGARIDPPAPTKVPMSQPASAKPRPTTSSEGEFFDHMQTKRPDVVGPFQSFLATLGEIGVTPEIGKTARLRFAPSPDTSATAGYVEANGKLWTQGAWSAANRLGRPDAGDRYLQTVADIIGGQVRRYEKAAPEVVDVEGHGADLAVLLTRADRWKQAIAELSTALATADA
jgi:hypothetical protein